jgi:phenylacetate-CoA ligase
VKALKRQPDGEFDAGLARAIQAEKFRKQLDWCARRSPFYKRLFRDLGIDPGEIGIDALEALPVTTKDDFARHNADFLAVPPESIVDIVLSSGTTGKPVQVMYSERDLRRLAYNEELSFAACGVTSRDVALLTCTMDRCFVAGMAYFLGLRQLGAAVIRNGHGTLTSHELVIKTIRPTVLVGVPSFLRKLGMYLRERGEDPAAGSVRKLVCIGEPVRGEDMAPLRLGCDLREVWNADVYSTYASSECVTTFCECVTQNGGHLHPELALVEILDTQGRRLPAGACGEVVLTPLDMEGMPVLRFATGDISFMLEDPCACGRTAPRLGPILGRKQQLMKIRGTSVYPQAVFNALDELAGVGDYYLELRENAELSDELVVHLAGISRLPPAASVAEHLQARIRVTPVIVVDPEDEVRHHLYSSESRKPVRVLDRRKQG